MTNPTARWTLAYEAEGSDDAAWVLRYGTGADTVVYETNTDLSPDMTEAAQGWAVLMLGKRHDVAVTFWTEHKPGPGTSPDYWIASTDFAPRAAEDVTEELVQQAVDIVDGWYNEGRIDWEDVFDRLEKHTLDNGQGIDLGEDLGSPALKTLQRRVRAARKEH